VIKLSEDGGTVNLYTPAAEIGQGSDTILTQMAAEALGVRYGDVRITSGDTDLGVDLGAYSSRQTLMSGHAVKQAAEDARRQVLEVLSEKLGIPVDDMDIRDGLILFNRDGVDFSAIRTGYLKEHRGWTDPPAGDRLTFGKRRERRTCRGGP
jgi:4-hydroxybenzoyl-CoA reductase subunit alpha